MAKHIKVGITHGDYNGIGYEVIIKALGEEGMTELLTPVIFGSEKALNFYRKSTGYDNLRYQRISDAAEAREGTVNLIDISDGDIFVEPGKPSETAGRYALKALVAAVEALKAGSVDVLVTAPIDKSTIHSDDFDFPGHTEFLEYALNEPDAEVHDCALMILTGPMLKVALVTTHLPISEVAGNITVERVAETIIDLYKSLKRDYRCECPRIAVLGLNPHCGDHGIAGDEEDTIISPVIEKLRSEGIMAFGPYAADGFFGSGAYAKFDGIVAMYHDQGLAPFKALVGSDGVNYTAGLKYVRTSPDHGTGYDIAGRNMADPLSMRHAIFDAIDIYRARQDYEYARRNPLRSLPAERDQRKNRAAEPGGKENNPPETSADNGNNEPETQEEAGQ